MDSALVLGALRSWLLDHAPLTSVVGQGVYVSRADVAGRVPAIALELAGGEGQFNQAMDRMAVDIAAWSSVSWAEALSALTAAASRLRNASRATGLPSPLLRVSSVGAPRQVSEGDYYHATLTVTVIAKEV